MPTSAPGNEGRCAGGCPRATAASAAVRPAGWLRRARVARRARGFTLVEVLLVLAIAALAASLVTWAVPDRRLSRLEAEADRLSALLEWARAEARVAGVPVWWMPLASGAAVDDGAGAADFRFVGLPPSQGRAVRWLHAGTQAEVVGGRGALQLGPEAIVPAQRVVLRLDGLEIELSTDGLAPFAPPAVPTP